MNNSTSLKLPKDEFQMLAIHINNIAIINNSVPPYNTLQYELKEYDGLEISPMLDCTLHSP